MRSNTSTTPTASRRTILAGAASTAALWPAIIRAQTLQTIRLAGVPTDDLTPVYYAIDKGLYRRAGLDVSVVPTSSGSVATEAVMTGAYEMGKGSLIAALVAHTKNLPVILVGNGAYWDVKSPFAMMVVAADSTIKTGADLNGKTISTPALHDLNELSMKLWVDQNGGDSTTLKVIEIPNSLAGAALADHRVDATVINEPPLSAAIGTGKVRILAPSYSAFAEHFALTVYFAQPSWATQNRDALSKWLRVTYDTARYTNAHHAETVALMVGITKIPEATIATMSRTAHATSSAPALIQPLIDAAAKYKFIDHAFPAAETYFTL